MIPSGVKVFLASHARDDRTLGRDGPPMVACRFEDSRSGECAVRHLNGYRGILQVDGYAAYNKLARSDRGNDGVTLAGCWSHCRPVITRRDDWNRLPVWHQAWHLPSFHFHRSARAGLYRALAEGYLGGSLASVMLVRELFPAVVQIDKKGARPAKHTAPAIHISGWLPKQEDLMSSARASMRSMPAWIRSPYYAMSELCRRG
ncbi:hypothetical protein ACVIHI_000087 [Bradyrhizobium sp. USDA 4524]|nr:hypothetical protein [Bradyrhizobium sp. USDA 4538]MCP1899113.1 hypothetical protein [Bradyrhizobium sp. USDA 4537]MCP1986774.1 hypothetical protein [Bradyrhizobium sp. USDA 4539]